MNMLMDVLLDDQQIFLQSTCHKFDDQVSCHKQDRFANIIWVH